MGISWHLNKHVFSQTFFAQARSAAVFYSLIKVTQLPKSCITSFFLHKTMMVHKDIDVKPKALVSAQWLCLCAFVEPVSLSASHHFMFLTTLNTLTELFSHLACHNKIAIFTWREKLLPPICRLTNEVDNGSNLSSSSSSLADLSIDWLVEHWQGAPESSVITMFSHTAGTQICPQLQNLISIIFFQRSTKQSKHWGFCQFDDCMLLGVIHCVKLGFRWLLLSCFPVAQILLRSGHRCFFAFFSASFTTV